MRCRADAGLSPADKCGGYEAVVHGDIASIIQSNEPRSRADLKGGFRQDLSFERRSRNEWLWSGAAALPFCPGDQDTDVGSPIFTGIVLPFAHLALARLPGVTTARF